MKEKLTIIALVAAVVGLGASLASAIDDLGPQLTFCAETGCKHVKESWWASPLGIPMSVIGVLYFSAMLALTFGPYGPYGPYNERRRLRLVLAIAGGAWAIWLLVLQAFVIGAWCKLCVVADPAAIVLAGAVIAGAATLRPSKKLALLVPALGAIVGALALWTRPPALEIPADTPNFVINEQRPDTVTIVELVDFECPHCREMQKRLDEALTKTKVPVRIVRKMVPLPMHPGAGPAAIAYCCADMQGKGEEMAKLLFAADPEKLDPYNCQQMAIQVGCDLERFKKDVPAAIKRIQADLDQAKAANVKALPTLFIGHTRHTGASLSVDELVAEIERHAR